MAATVSSCKTGYEPVTWQKDYVYTYLTLLGGPEGGAIGTCPSIDAPWAWLRGLPRTGLSVRGKPWMGMSDRTLLGLIGGYGCREPLDLGRAPSLSDVRASDGWSCFDFSRSLCVWISLWLEDLDLALGLPVDSLWLVNFSSVRKQEIHVNYS